MLGTPGKRGSRTSARNDGPKNFRRPGHLPHTANCRARTAPGEGFTDIRYIRYPKQTDNWPPRGVASREFDIGLSFITTDLVHIDEGDPIVILAGSHIGCTEVFASRRVRSTTDLKGTTVAISKLRSDEHLFISMIAAYVGLHPERDINWVVRPHAEDIRLLAKETLTPSWLVRPHRMNCGRKGLVMS